MPKKNIHLVIIDPQNDFVDLPDECCPQTISSDLSGGDRHHPALPVNGAHDDMLRLAALINMGGSGISQMTVTLDSHNRIDIGHHVFWMTKEGETLAPYSLVTRNAIIAGDILARNPPHRSRARQYFDDLAEVGVDSIMAWPVHCEIGTWGHNVHAHIADAYGRWELSGNRSVFKVLKGMSPWSENYSAVQAVVPDPLDPSTRKNQEFLSRVWGSSSDLILIAGEAGSHCVRDTVTDLVKYRDGHDVRKLVLLTDCMSPVPGFENQYAEFIEMMREFGARITTSAGILPELLENSR